MTAFKAYLNSREVQKVLSKKPGEEGFSLIELVVVIAVLAILAAVAIPAFNGIQNDARASAVKAGMANGIKECLVLQARDQSTDKFANAKAFKNDDAYKAYTISAWGGRNFPDGTAVGAKGCMGVKAEVDSSFEGTLPNLYMAISSTGEVNKACGGENANTKAKWDNKAGSEAPFCW